jgi:RNA polymerase sigma-70 factor (ECF subfamily)
MPATDEELVRRTRDGDQSAFGILVERYLDMVYGLGYHMTTDFETARDCAQETLVQAYLKLDQLRDAGRFASWLRQIAVNVCRAHQRRPHVDTVSLEANDVGEPPRRPPSSTELLVREALDKLRPADRLSLTLHYINGYSHSEIGNFLGVRAETVKTRLARARQHLREEMIQMVEHAFEQRSLPSEFRRNVVRAVNQLVTNMRAALPENVGEVLSSIRRERNQRWRDILSQLPPPFDQPLVEQSEGPPRIPVTALPEDLRQQVRDAMCLTWVDYVLDSVHNALPWTSDFDVLWIRFFNQSDEPHVRLGDVPGNSGTIIHVRIADGAVGRQPTDEGSTEALDEALRSCPLPREVRDSLEALRGMIPGTRGSLQKALYAEMARLMRQVRDQLPATARRAMDSGDSVSVRDLPESLRRSLRRTVAMQWGAWVLEIMENSPTWLTDFEKSEIEFGLYAGEGTTYMNLHGPSGYECQFQTGIADP